MDETFEELMARLEGRAEATFARVETTRAELFDRTAGKTVQGLRDELVPLLVEATDLDWDGGEPSDDQLDAMLDALQLIPEALAIRTQQLVRALAMLDELCSVVSAIAGKVTDVDLGIRMGALVATTRQWVGEQRAAG